MLTTVRFLCLLRGRGPVYKMASQQRSLSVCSVLRCSELWLQCSVSFVHDLKMTHYKNNVAKLYRQLVENGCLCKGRSPGLPRVYDDNTERVCEAFQRSPCKSVARESRELGMQKMTAWKVLRKRLCFKPVQALTPAEEWKYVNFVRRCSWKWKMVVS
jgi:hypothetical protein